MKHLMENNSLSLIGIAVKVYMTIGVLWSLVSVGYERLSNLQ